MVTATFLAIFYIPLFFVVVERLFHVKQKQVEQPGSVSGEQVLPAKGQIT